MSNYFRKQFLIPDAMFKIRHGGQDHFFLLEIDKGTVAQKWMLKRYQAYYDWWKTGGHLQDFGITSVRILTVTTSQKRMDNLMRACCEIKRGGRGSALFWFTTIKNVDIFKPKRLLAHIWRKALTDDTKLYSLLD